MSTVRSATYDLLRDLGLTTMFGNPGSTEEPFLTEFPSDFRYILGLHEAAVVSMADGFAQASGQAAFVNLHTAPGVGNAMGSIVTAWYNRAPLVITAGQQTRQMLALEPWLVNLDATDLPKPYVKWSDEPVRPEDVPGAIERAYHIAMAPPRGPVFVSIPMDDWAAPASPRVPRRVESQSSLRYRDLDELAAALNAARNPALVVGGGVDRGGGWAAAIDLAERMQAPVWEAPAPERASFPQDHPFFQGALPLAIAPLAKALASHDLVLVAGASIFRYYPYIPGEHLAEGTRLVQITDDLDEAARAPVGTSLVGDIGDALHRLATKVNRTASGEVPRRPEPQRPDASNPIPVSYAMHAVSAAAPADVVITEESASMRAPFYDQFRINRPASYFATASGGLGFAMPAAVGASLARPAQPVLSIVGDGSAMFGIHALWTAAQHRCPIVYAVMNNGGYSILKAFADFQRTPGVPGLDLPGLDIATVARGLGVKAHRVSDADVLPDACRAAFAEAMSERCPVLLDVIVDPAVPKVFG